jgi:hypothetical protein
MPLSPTTAVGRQPNFDQVSIWDCLYISVVLAKVDSVNDIG